MEDFVAEGGVGGVGDAVMDDDVLKAVYKVVVLGEGNIEGTDYGISISRGVVLGVALRPDEQDLGATNNNRGGT